MSLDVNLEARAAGGAMAFGMGGSILNANGDRIASPWFSILQSPMHGVRIATAGQLGYTRTVILSGGDNRRSSTLVFINRELPANHVSSNLFVHAGSSIEAWSVNEPVIERGSVEIEVVTGSGATSLIPSTGHVEGVGLTIGSIWTVTDEATTTAFDRGLIAAHVPTVCSCRGSWTGPGGRSGSWTKAGYEPPNGDYIAAGPGGTWVWSVSGTGATEGISSEPVLGIVAPVGEFYVDFAEPYAW